jgi:hypothetical protein
MFKIKHELHVYVASRPAPCSEAKIVRAHLVRPADGSTYSTDCDVWSGKYKFDNSATFFGPSSDMLRHTRWGGGGKYLT